MKYRRTLFQFIALVAGLELWGCAPLGDPRRYQCGPQVSPTDRASITQAVEAFLCSTLAKEAAPGAAAARVSLGEVTWTGHFGDADLASGEMSPMRLSSRSLPSRRASRHGES
jgi:hypothetical protein